MKSIDQQLAILRRGVVPEVWEDMQGPLAERLAEGRPLRIKCGFDPTAPDLHLGHTVVMTKMRQFQELGHEVTFLVGDFTARIGDPTGKSQTRPPLSSEEVARHAETYRSQVHKVLAAERTTLAFNSEWLGALGAENLIRLAARHTVARMLERNDFRQRYASGQAISIHEFLYPLLQGYDSVALETDVELGGNDQLFNLMVGREIMRHYGLPPQVILTTPLLIGTDGHLAGGALVGEKMSKSLGNTIGVEDPPSGESGIFGKLMAISDPLMWHYYELLSTIDDDELHRRRTEWHPKVAKRALAHEICARYHGTEAADAAAGAFDRIHPPDGGMRGTPENVEAVTLEAEGAGLFLSRVLLASGLAGSNGAARRLISQGGVQVNGERRTDPSDTLPAGESYLIKAGKRRFRRVTITGRH